ncbi:MAG: hypothetical protein WCI87_09640 [Euryarchaeota archaeon]
MSPRPTIEENILENQEKMRERMEMLLLRVKGIYEDLSGVLDVADQEKDEFCLALSNYADDTADFLSRVDLAREAEL